MYLTCGALAVVGALSSQLGKTKIELVSVHDLNSRKAQRPLQEGSLQVISLPTLRWLMGDLWEH